MEVDVKVLEAVDVRELEVLDMGQFILGSFRRRFVCGQRRGAHFRQ